MKGNYFLDTSGEKYKDVRASGRCLRCYSNKHKVAMGTRLKTNTSQTPSFDPIVEEWEDQNDFTFFDLPVLVSDSESDSDSEDDPENRLSGMG